MWVMLALFVGSGGALAKPSDEQVGELAVFFTLFPELRTLPAPTFVRPGVRVSYQSAAAAVGGGGSGAGISQYDVVSSDGEQVLVYDTLYGDDGLGAYPLTTAVGAGVPGLGPFWLNPRVLVGAERLSGNGLTVTRYTKEVIGEQATVVRFQTATGDGTTVYEFDASTGLMVFSSASAGSSLGQTTVVGVRTLAFPWALDRAPNWVRVGAALTYSGTRATTVPAAGTVSQPVTLTQQITAAGAHWSTFAGSSTLNGQPQGESVGLTGSAQQLAAFWLPRAALSAGLSATGTEIDVDPLTQAHVYVALDASSGTPLIVIQQQAPSAVTSYFYDRTFGALVRIVQTQETPAASFATDLSLTGGSDLAALASEPELPDDPPIVAAGGGGGGGGGAGGCAGGGVAWWGALVVAVLRGSSGPRRRARAASRR